MGHVKKTLSHFLTSFLESHFFEKKGEIENDNFSTENLKWKIKRLEKRNQKLIFDPTNLAHEQQQCIFIFSKIEVQT